MKQALTSITCNAQFTSEIGSRIEYLMQTDNIN